MLPIAFFLLNPLNSLFHVLILKNLFLYYICSNTGSCGLHICWIYSNTKIRKKQWTRSKLFSPTPPAELLILSNRGSLRPGSHRRRDTYGDQKSKPGLLCGLQYEYIGEETEWRRTSNNVNPYAAFLSLFITLDACFVFVLAAIEFGHSLQKVIFAAGLR
jgi:hypothetical protein